MALHVDVSKVFDDWHFMLMCLKCGRMAFHVDVSKIRMNDISCLCVLNMDERHSMLMCLKSC